jgi:hypothetical protein
VIIVSATMHEHCGSFTTVAALDAERYIARCSCGALHLQWQNWTLQFQPDDLELIVRTLERSQTLCAQDKNTFVLERGQYASYAVSLEASGAYRFWYGKSAVLLPREDWVAMRDLMTMARQSSSLNPRFERSLAAVLNVN